MKRLPHIRFLWVDRSLLVASFSHWKLRKAPPASVLSELVARSPVLGRPSVGGVNSGSVSGLPLTALAVARYGRPDVVSRVRRREEEEPCTAPSSSSVVAPLPRAVSLGF